MKTHPSFSYSALAAAILSTSLALVAPAASAGTVSCPGTVATTDREFSLTTAVNSTCLLTGTGNINGNNDAVNLLGYITLDKSDDGTTGPFPAALTVAGVGTTSGSFSFTAPVGYNDFVVGLKSGEGRFAPDWAAFLLPVGVTSGTWAISSQGLSHIVLYGKVTAVPVPAAVWLLGSALVSVGAAGRRKTEKV